MTKKKLKQNPAPADSRFSQVVRAFEKDRTVSQGSSKGFGSGALKVNGKIFAMKSSRGELVVKLPQKRVHELVMNGIGTRFDPGHGRLMKEWLVIKASGVTWTDVAREACEFVKQPAKCTDL